MIDKPGKQVVLIIGASGMLGHTLFFNLSKEESLDVFATVRNRDELAKRFPSEYLKRIISGIDTDNVDALVKVIAEIKPDVVINCVGIIKQLDESKDSLKSISVNALFPHRMATICAAAGSRFIQIGTDCVFDGSKGNYSEDDRSDAYDLYGKTKYLGEVDYPNCVTLRTSIIGHELKGKRSLVEWFLAQQGEVRGYANAIYSGFPTVEMARIISRYVIPNQDLSGLYHVSSEPISKLELLRLIVDRYNKEIDIVPFDDFYIDRSLDSTRFRAATGYVSPAWPELIDKMYQDFISAPYYDM
jgi:dTDP-4-dehydrorhamnose reductase